LSESDFSVNFEARPEWVAMVRRAMETLLGADIDVPLMGDVKAGVTEACVNAVRHAYPAGAGRVEVEAWLEPERLIVSVRDFGRGMAPSESRRRGPGLGLPLMEALSSGLEISSDDGAGTEVLLRFDLDEEDDGIPPPERSPLPTAVAA